ncbi:WD40 repeat domain-containing protein [Kitasatospora sp. NPDC058190]|uniref:WD40 repeat domain-containing protein n=1 Tax=Kitasatospora sp. NPDC058190 TaxID=3346371 RepID=UPI0036DA82D2
MRTIDLPARQAGHAAPVTHVAFQDGGRRVATCSYDGTVLVWDASDPARPQETARLRHRRLVNSSAWNPVDPELLATASADKTVGVWRVPEEGAAELLGVLARHTDDINSIAWMPDGQRLIAVSEDGRATLWHALDGTFLGEVGSHTAHCMMVSVSPQGLVATVGEDGMVAVSAPDTARDPLVRRYDSSVEGCGWSRSGQILAIACDDGTVELLTPELEPLQTIKVSQSAARAVAWAEDDTVFVVGAYDGSLHFFDTAGTALHRIHDARVWPRSVSIAKGMVATGSFWNGPHLFDITSAEAISSPEVATHGPNALARDGGDLFVGCDSGTVLAVGIDEPAGGPVRALALTDSPVLSLAVRDGVLYAGTYAGHVIRYEDGRVSASAQLGAPIPSLCDDGEQIVAGTYNGELVALDPATLTVVSRHAPHSGSVKSLAAFADGFLSAATDRTIAVGTFRDRRTLWEHGNLVNAVAVLGGEVAASASRDHTVKVGRFSGHPEHRVQTLLGPDESVKCVAVIGSPGAPVVLAGSYDFGLYAWNVDWQDGTGALTSGTVVAGFAQGVSCLLALDESRVAAAGWDGKIVIVGLAEDGAVGIQRTLHVNELESLARSSGKVVA